jgi:hypothetical protein
MSLRSITTSLQHEAAHDDERRGDDDVVLRAVLDVDRRAFRMRLVQHVPARLPALRDQEGFVELSRQRDRFCNRNPFVPRFHCETREAKVDFVERSRREPHEAAAAFAVARIEPERQSFAPRVFARLAEAHGAALRAWISFRLHVQADGFEGRDGVRIPGNGVPGKKEKQQCDAHGGIARARGEGNPPRPMRRRACSHRNDRLVVIH